MADVTFWNVVLDVRSPPIDLALKRVIARLLTADIGPEALWIAADALREAAEHLEFEGHHRDGRGLRWIIQLVLREANGRASEGRPKRVVDAHSG